jgi:hypothetical protein
LQYFGLEDFFEIVETGSQAGQKKMTEGIQLVLEFLAGIKKKRQFM